MTAALSVILPVRNAEAFIGDTLTSLRANAGPGIEFLVIDDGSDDATPEVIDDHRAALPGMQVITHSTAKGLADARNVGLDRAEGRYVTFLDGDDWLAPGYLPDLVAAIDSLGCDFVRVDHVQVHGRRRVTHRAPIGRRGVVLDPRLGILPANRTTMVDYPFAWAGVYQRSLGDILRFPSGLHTAEDRPWVWRLHRELASFAVVSLAGVFYRRLVTTSLTQVGDERQLHFFDSFAQVFDDLRADASAERYWPKAAQQFAAVLGYHLTRLDRFERPLARQFRSRATAAVADLPDDIFATVRLSGARAQALRRILPTGHPMLKGLRP